MRWWRRRSEEDFDDEIRSHIAHEVDRLLARGLSRADAEAEARRAFGDVTAVRDQFLEAQPSPRWEDLLRDFVLAFRSMRQEPWLAAGAVATLGLGIGLNTAIFTVLYGVALRPLPLPDADRLVTVHQSIEGMPYGTGFGDASMGNIGGRPRRIDGSTDMVSYPEHLDYREVGALSGLAAFASVGATLEGETPSRVTALLVTCDYFRVLGARSEIGRTFVDDECMRSRTAPVAVLDHGFWQRRFGGERSIVGRTITLNRTELTVVGVAAPGFGGTGLRAPNVYLPVTVQPAFGDDRLADDDHSWLSLVGRLAPGSTIERAETELTAVARRRDAAYVDRETSMLVYRATLLARPETGRLWPGIAAIAAAVGGLIVLIACLNVMNLLLSRAPARQRNVRIRLSIGASRRRIVTQLLVESIVLAGLAGLLGLLLAYRAPLLLLAIVDLGGIQLDLTPDLRVLGFASIVSLGAAVLFGLTPALEITRVDLATALRSDGAAAGAGRAPRIARLRHVIVGAQVAGSMLLLAIAVLFTRGVEHAYSIDLGFRVEDVIGLRPALDEQGYDGERGASYYRELRARVAALPGVRSTALTHFLPLGPRSAGNFRRPGADEDEGLIAYVTVSGAYFETLGIPIERGRGFAEDEAFGEVIPAVISQTMARHYWPEADPIGKPFRAGSKAFVVVGVARDTRHFSIEYDEPMFYAAARLDPLPGSAGDRAVTPPPSFTLAVHTTADESVPSAILRVAGELDPAVRMSTQSLEQRFADRVRSTRLVATLAALLGALATALAIVGVYGTIAYAVSRRRHEIGIRFALGADRADIVGLVLRQGAGSIIGGIAAGVLLAAAVARLLRGLLFGFSPIDPIAFLIAGVLLIGVAILATLQPARKAAGIDPASALRAD